MLNCRINQNIRKECDTHVGGIYDTIYLYDINDVESLSFTNDTRFDSGASVATINSSKPFFVFEVSDGEYEEENDGNEYTHELTANIHKTEDIEKILSDAKNSNFLVAFRLKSEGTYRLFGWDLGAKLSYTLTAGEDGNYYTITFTDEGIYPSFETDASNFDLRNKVFEPLFVPDFTISTCETAGGKLTGYRIASYVTKRNAAGEALDDENKLCEYSGSKQIAYKLSGVSDAQYDVIGTFNSDAIYNGQVVKMYDAAHCSTTGEGTITVSPNPITLSAHGRSSVPLSITTIDTWSIANNTPFADVSKYSGKGNSNVNVLWNGLKSNNVGTLIVHNENTNETVPIITRFFGVWVDAPESVDYSVGGVMVYVDAVGGSKGRTIDVQCSDPNVSYTIQQNTGSIVIVFDKDKVGVNGCTFTIKVTHNDYESEFDTAVVKVRGDETGADWKAVSSSCELVDGQRNGYKIIRYRDQNPKSPTYGQIKQERELSEDCAKGGEQWVEVTRYCEIDTYGMNTGYKIIIEQQIKEGYPSTGTTRQTKIKDETFCPHQTTDPKWVTINEWCLSDEYGQYGEKEMIQQDQNIFSPTFHSTRNIKEMDLVACPPNTQPVWDIISSECLQDEGGNTGYERITYEDINPRSETKGQTKTETEYNEVSCPHGTSPKWTELSRVCQLDEDGDNTGYVEITQLDTNRYSPSYNETRTITEYDTTECQLPSTDPRWVTISYECQLDAQGYKTGVAIKQQRDENKKSETYNQTREITETDLTLCDNNAPQWEVKSAMCETDAYGGTGNKITTYIDTNPHSVTYGSTRKETTYDAVNCPPNTEPYWVTESSECEKEE